MQCNQTVKATGESLYNIKMQETRDGYLRESGAVKRMYLEQITARSWWKCIT